MDTTPLLERAYRYALALTHDRARAEDLLHDGWVRACRRGRTHSLGYLVAAIRSAWIDGQRRGALAPMVDLPDDISGGTPRNDEALDARDEIGAALGSLSIDERETLFLNAVEGWSAAEIGRLTGRSRNTVLTVLARARHRLGARRSAQEGDP